LRVLRPPTRRPKQTAMFASCSGRWSNQQLFVEVDLPNLTDVEVQFLRDKSGSTNRMFVESIATGQAEKGIQSSSRASLKHDAFQRPKAQKDAHVVPTTHNTVTGALTKFGIPCTDSHPAPGTENDSSLSFGQGATVKDPPAGQNANLKSCAHQSEIRNPLLHRQLRGRALHTMWAREMQEVLIAGSLFQAVETQPRESAKTVDHRQSFQKPNPPGVPPLLSTSPVGTDQPGAALNTPTAQQLEQEAKRVRCSSEALVGKTTLVVRNIPAR